MQIELIQNRGGVQPLPVGAHTTINAVADWMNNSTETRVRKVANHDQTIHGHIVTLYVEKGYYIEGDENKALRMGKDDLEFWFEIRKDIRWVECYNDRVLIGL